MKNLIFIFFTLALCSSCFAQNTLKDGKYNYDGKNFRVKKTTYLDRSLISLRAVGRFENTPPPLPKDPYGYPPNRKDIHFDIDKVKEIVNDALVGKKKDLQENKDRIDISFDFLREGGSIESISYSFNGNTLINLKDIAKIDRELKKNIKATFTGNEYKNFFLISYSEVSIVY